MYDFNFEISGPKPDYKSDFHFHALNPMNRAIHILIIECHKQACSHWMNINWSSDNMVEINLNKLPTH